MGIIGSILAIVVSWFIFRDWAEGQKRKREIVAQREIDATEQRSEIERPLIEIFTHAGHCFEYRVDFPKMAIDGADLRRTGANEWEQATGREWVKIESVLASKIEAAYQVFLHLP